MGWGYGRLVVVSIRQAGILQRRWVRMLSLLLWLGILLHNVIDYSHGR